MILVSAPPYYWRFSDGRVHELKVDDVKIRFLPKYFGQRTETMWILITQIGPNGWFEGKLDNNPNTQYNKTYGEAVRFHVSQIMDIY